MGHPPFITCVCPTYGRFTRLRDSIGFFLHQDYPYKRLIILNDAPVPILCDYPNVDVMNVDSRMESLGVKRQVLLNMVGTKLTAHWDDDDVYLPWHLSECVRALQESQKGIARPKRGWRMAGSFANEYRIKEPKANRYEGQWSFVTEAARKHGGYTKAWSGQCKPMMAAAKAADDRYVYEPLPSWSYAYRWESGVSHISSRGNTTESHDAFGSKNTDFGDGVEPLRPSMSRMREFLAAFIQDAPQYLETNAIREDFLTRLSCWSRSAV